MLLGLIDKRYTSCFHVVFSLIMSHENRMKIVTDYYRLVSIIWDYFYRLLLKANMITLLTKVVVDVCGYSSKVPLIFVLF